MKKVIITFVVLFVQEMTFARVPIMSIEVMAAMSDRIVIGEIVKVNKLTYDFKVSEIIKGNHDTMLTIQKTKNWTCDGRYAEETIGQKLILFIKTKDNKLSLIDGNKSGFPIINNMVDLTYERRIVKGKPMEYVLNINELKTGLAFFSSCFSLQNPIKFVKVFERRCSKKDIRNLRHENEFFNWIYMKTKKNYKVVKPQK